MTPERDTERAGVGEAGASREERIRVARTARYRVLGEPSSCAEPWFVLHGYRQLAGRFIRRFEALPGLATGRRAVVAPEALSRFYIGEGEGRSGPHGPESRVGASWMTREDRDHEIRDYVEYLDALAARVLRTDASAAGVAGPDRDAGSDRAGGSVVLGFSQGAEAASRWCVLGRVRPAELILWGGGLAADLDVGRAAEALAGVRVAFVVGDRDEWARRRSAEGMAVLERAGVSCRAVNHAGGHRVEPAVLAAEWAVEKAVE